MKIRTESRHFTISQPIKMCDWDQLDMRWRKRLFLTVSILSRAYYRISQITTPVMLHLLSYATKIPLPLIQQCKVQYECFILPLALCFCSTPRGGNNRPVSIHEGAASWAYSTLFDSPVHFTSNHLKKKNQHKSIAPSRWLAKKTEIMKMIKATINSLRPQWEDCSSLRRWMCFFRWA